MKDTAIKRERLDDVALLIYNSLLTKSVFHKFDRSCTLLHPYLPTHCASAHWFPESTRTRRCYSLSSKPLRPCGDRAGHRRLSSDMPSRRPRQSHAHTSSASDAA